MECGVGLSVGLGMWRKDKEYEYVRTEHRTGRGLGVWRGVDAGDWACGEVAKDMKVLLVRNDLHEREMSGGGTRTHLCAATDLDRHSRSGKRPFTRNPRAPAAGQPPPVRRRAPLYEEATGIVFCLGHQCRGEIIRTCVRSHVPDLDLVSSKGAKLSVLLSQHRDACP